MTLFSTTFIAITWGCWLIHHGVHAFVRDVHISAVGGPSSPTLCSSADDTSNNADDFLSQLAGGFEFVSKSSASLGKKALLQQQAGTYDKEIIQAQIQALVDNDPVAMLSFTTCPYCEKAKKLLLDSYQIQNYKILELDQLPGLQSYAFRAELAELTDRTSVPAIWIGGEFVGGCNDGGSGDGGLMALHESGKLTQLLEDAGAV